MPLTWRHSALDDRHRALGSNLEDWNGMGAAWTYAHDIHGDHKAIRNGAGLMDVSGLKKYHIVGPHAQAVLDYVTTRDTSKLYPGKSAYASILNGDGKFVDDCIIYRTGPNAWMWVHGGGHGLEMLSPSLAGRNVSLLFDDDMHDLSLQGPKAVDFLDKHIPGTRSLKYFHHIQTQLFGKPIMLSRTGYSGERGYEIFCKAEDAPTIWDTIVAEGKSFGIVPAQFATLDMVRVESSLLFYPYDNSETYPFDNGDPVGDTLWELGLDFTVSPRKTGFRGADAHYRAKGKERFKINGVYIDDENPPAGGTELFDAKGKKVGVITGAMRSKMVNKTMAIARLDVPAATEGTKLEIRGEKGKVAVTVQNLPFDDPDKKKRSASG